MVTTKTRDFLDDLHAEFLAYKRFNENLTDRTIEWHEVALKMFRRVSSEAPTPDTIGAFIRDCHQRHLAATSINCYLRSLRTFCAWLFEMGYAAQPVAIKELKEPQPVIEVFSVSEVTKLLAAPMKPRLRFLIVLILKTGLRIEEALALRWDDVNLDAGTLHVRSGKGRKGRVIPLEVDCDPPLWGFSIRPLWHPYRRKFRTLSTRVAGGRLRLPQETTWVFPTRNNTPWDQDTARRWLHKAMQAAGVRRDHNSGWHLLRHSYATECLRRGGSGRRLQRRLGHSRSSTTDRYEHFVTDDLKQL